MDDMMQYTVLAEHYDRLTFDVDYQGYAAFADRLFRKHKIPGRLILEQACGTGSISLELSRMGYEMISSDISPDMLSVAQEKCGELECPPVFLCQDMCELDLYGTVDGCICGLDSINYLTELWQVKRAIKRVSLFMNKGGLFIFDIKTPQMFMKLDGVSSIWEEDDMFAAWQYGYDKKSMRAFHAVDIFEHQPGGEYRRYSETHEQRAYDPEKIKQILIANGFKIVGIYKNTSMAKASGNEDRLYFAALKI
ncbi:MAG: class I SAM-dependent methyltransferase [Clostridia bacterium]|nr:class I SAM-dependent methyltransferase [Clostridia bacterium]MBQ2326216.1 class I SAM-dependent methyltransferase [Clostridia bacterium]MBQ5812619.1 class I SAM-dependent methyltransferase [Clostridia bacterium]